MEEENSCRRKRIDRWQGGPAKVARFMSRWLLRPLPPAAAAGRRQRERGSGAAARRGAAQRTHLHWLMSPGSPEATPAHGSRSGPGGGAGKRLHGEKMGVCAMVGVGFISPAALGACSPKREGWAEKEAGKKGDKNVVVCENTRHANKPPCMVAGGRARGCFWQPHERAPAGDRGPQGDPRPSQKKQGGKATQRVVERSQRWGRSASGEGRGEKKLGIVWPQCGEARSRELLMCWATRWHAAPPPGPGGALPVLHRKRAVV